MDTSPNQVHQQPGVQLASELLELETEEFTIVDLPDLDQHAAKLIFMTMMIATVSGDPHDRHQAPHAA